MKEASAMFRKFIQKIFNHHLIFGGVFFILGSIFFPNYLSFASSQVSLEWSPNSEPDLAGYKAFCREEGKSYDYTHPSWEGTQTACTIYGLDETLTYCFVARAFDIEGFESGDSEEVCYAATILPVNAPPTASAGPNQTVDEKKSVTLNGSNSTDPDDGIASYQWTQIGGPSITLSGANGMESTFIAPDVGPEGAALTFELTVLDYNGSQSKDVCVVNVTWLNTPPQANAGFDQTVSEGTQVTLDGSASLDIDDGIASYLWVQTGGSAVVLSDPSVLRPTFTTSNVGPDGASFIFELTVTDAGGLWNRDACIVNITWKNQSPSAVVEDYIEAEEGTTVVLDGSKSTDPDDGIKSYHWDQLEGLPVTLSDPGSARPNFVAPKANPNGENLIFRLTVKDVGGLQGSANGHVYVMSAASSSDQVSILSVNYNPKPRKLKVKAISTASPGSVQLTAWATHGNETVNLGDLIYSTREQTYEKTFRKVDFKPTSITVISSGGGTDTK
jgi:hypothetical protein